MCQMKNQTNNLWKIIFAIFHLSIKTYHFNKPGMTVGIGKKFPQSHYYYEGKKVNNNLNKF